MKRIVTTTVAVCFAAVFSINIMAQKDRSEIEEKYKWNVYDLFANDDEWNAKKDEINERIKTISSYKGRLSESASTLLEFFNTTQGISKDLSRLSIYASLQKDQDLGVSENIARTKELDNVYIDLSQTVAFADPELAAIEDEKYDRFMDELPELKRLYGMRIDRIKRNKPHTLSPVEEELVAKMSILGNPVGETFDIFSDAEMPWPTIKLSDGSEVELNQAAYSQVRASANREDREKAFDAFWGNYRRFEGTFGELMK